MPSARRVKVHCRHHQVNSGESLTIPSGDFTSTSDPIFEMLKLDAEKRGLKFVKTRVTPAARKTVATLSSVVAQLTDRLRNHGIVRGYCTPITECPQILRGIKTPCSGIASTTDWATIERFAAILNKVGYSSPIRTPRGRDILAACGQLKSESEKVRASVRRKAETLASG